MFKLEFANGTVPLDIYKRIHEYKNQGFSQARAANDLNLELWCVDTYWDKTRDEYDEYFKERTGMTPEEDMIRREEELKLYEQYGQNGLLEVNNIFRILAIVLSVILIAASLILSWVNLNASQGGTTSYIPLLFPSDVSYSLMNVGKMFTNFMLNADVMALLGNFIFIGILSLVLPLIGYVLAALDVILIIFLIVLPKFSKIIGLIITILILLLSGGFAGLIIYLNVAEGIDIIKLTIVPYIYLAVVVIRYFVFIFFMVKRRHINLNQGNAQNSQRENNA